MPAETPASHVDGHKSPGRKLQLDFKKKEHHQLNIG
jgi:hypothetical protein